MILCWIFLESLVQAQAANLNFILQQDEPYSYVENETPKGPIVDVVREIAKRTGYTLTLQGNHEDQSSWTTNRPTEEEKKKIHSINQLGLEAVSNGAAGLGAFSLVRNANRERQYKWVGPMGYINFVLVKKKGSKIRTSTLADAKKYKTAAANGEFAEKIEKILRQADVVNYVQGDSIAELHNILSGKRDLLLINEIYLYGALRAEKMDPNSFDIALSLQSDKKFYIGFSKKTPDKIIRDWQLALDVMKKEGIVDRIFVNHKEASPQYFSK